MSTDRRVKETSTRGIWDPEVAREIEREMNQARERERKRREGRGREQREHQKG